MFGRSTDTSSPAANPAAILVRTYTARAYPGKITLFRASWQPGGSRRDPTLGWCELAGGGLEIHEVPGHHSSIALEPRVDVLAEKLRMCLDRAQKESSHAPRMPLPEVPVPG